MTIKAKGVVLVLAAAALIFSGCGPSKEDELNRQIQAQIAVVDREVQALEKHQEALHGIVADMQVQIDLMNEELNQSAPRIHAAGGAVKYLDELTTTGFGESPAHYTLRNSHQWGWTTIGVVCLGLFIIWLFVRIRHRSVEPK